MGTSNVYDYPRSLFDELWRERHNPLRARVSYQLTAWDVMLTLRRNPRAELFVPWGITRSRNVNVLERWLEKQTGDDMYIWRPAGKRGGRRVFNLTNRKQVHRRYRRP